MLEVREGWIKCQLPDVAEIVMGQSPPSSSYNVVGLGLPFFQGKAEFGSLFPQVKKHCDTPKKIAEAGDILISVRAPVGPTNLCREKSCIGRGLAAIRPSGATSSRFLLYFLRNTEPWLAARGTGSTFSAISKAELESVDVFLPPLEEQRRVVAKLEKLLAKVDDCKERLEKIPGILKHFRQSVLAAACDGRLTADWRESHPEAESSKKLLSRVLCNRRDLSKRNRGKFQEPMRPDGVFAVDAPDDWSRASMDELSCFITSGSRGWAKYYSETGPLFIRAQNISTDELLLDNIAHVRPPRNAEGSRTRVCVGDILITITGANVTKSAVVVNDLGEAYISQHVALVRPVDETTVPFLFLWLISLRHGRDQLLAKAYGAGKPGLNLTNLREVVVALPPLSEQREIVHRVEALFKFADRIEERYKKARDHVDKLTQSILAKAFRGELVPQHPNDEPASVLLERIREERAAKDIREKAFGRGRRPVRAKRQPKKT